MNLTAFIRCCRHLTLFSTSIISRNHPAQFQVHLIRTHSAQFRVHLNRCNNNGRQRHHQTHRIFMVVAQRQSLALPHIRRHSLHNNCHSCRCHHHNIHLKHGCQRHHQAHRNFKLVTKHQPLARLHTRSTPLHNNCHRCRYHHHHNLYLARIHMPPEAPME